MRNEDVIERYFDWLIGIVVNTKEVPDRYQKLLNQLFNIPFIYAIPLDGNRAEDGIDLRYRFGYDNNLDQRTIASCLDIRECTVLEMLIALCVRVEEHIMSDDNFGDRTAKWFWTMIGNLGLDQMTDDNYDPEYVDAVIDRWMYREYEPNGKGGLFIFDHPKRDIRDVEIWYQTMWYLNDVLGK